MRVVLVSSRNGFLVFAHDDEVLLDRRSGDRPRPPELPAALGSHVGVQVTASRRAVFQLAGAGRLDPFLDALVRLVLLRHV